MAAALHHIGHADADPTERHPRCASRRAFLTLQPRRRGWFGWGVRQVAVARLWHVGRLCTPNANATCNPSPIDTGAPRTRVPTWACWNTGALGWIHGARCEALGRSGNVLVVQLPCSGFQLPPGLLADRKGLRAVQRFLRSLRDVDLAGGGVGHWVRQWTTHVCVKARQGLGDRVWPSLHRLLRQAASRATSKRRCGAVGWVHVEC